MTPSTRIESTVEDPETVAAALRPDNTADVSTTVEGGSVVTIIDRESTASLEATVDDYLLNLDVALSVAQTTKQYDNTTNS